MCSCWQIPANAEREVCTHYEFVLCSLQLAKPAYTMQAQNGNVAPATFSYHKFVPNNEDILSVSTCLAQGRARVLLVSGL